MQIDPSLNNSTLEFILVFSHKKKTKFSLIFSLYFVTKIGSREFLFFNSYLAPVVTTITPEIVLRVSYQTLKVDRFAPPYDTMCGRYPLGSAQFDQIYKNMRRDAVKMFNKSIQYVMIMIYDLLDTPISSAYQLEQNEKLRRAYRWIWESKKANMPYTCSFITTFPKVYTIAYPTLGMTLMWPNGFRVHNESRARLVCIDYLICLFLYSIWLGFSVYGFSDLIKSVEFIKVTNLEKSDTISSLRQGMTPTEIGRLSRLELKFDCLSNQFRKLEQALKILIRK